MAIDFSQLSLPQVGKAPTHPIKIFEGLPRVPGAPNDLWRGQAQALEEWNTERQTSDVLVSLNTGAGKTVVGLLIAKSLVNEGLRNVLYVCPTIDLVEQTAKEADSLGIQYTTRTGSEFSNDLFESEKTFCITTYAAVFNGLSALRRRFFPDAVIFDDAHVAEVALRDAFTLTIKREKNSQLFDQIASIFRPLFASVDKSREFEETIDPGSRTSSLIFAPPFLVRTAAEQVTQAMARFGVDNDSDLKWSYANLRDKFDRCSIVFGKGVVEISPPFLPSRAIDIFERNVRRIYLSATLNNSIDVIRAFGRRPAKIIQPNNDAGNGERLIVFGRSLDERDITLDLVQVIKAKAKVLVAVPSYKAAEKWATVSAPPPRTEFSRALDLFRRSDSGAFILVSRVDGIDLPHATCRVMVMDGLPIAGSLIEHFMWEFLHMQGFLMNKMAGRVVQLFGRINRGRSDYGAFLIAGRDLNVWLQRDRFVALLPTLLQSQILLGRQVQSEMSVNNNRAVVDLIDQVVVSSPRDENWTNFYSRYIQAQQLEQDQADRAADAIVGLENAALAEADFAAKLWIGEVDAARNIFDESIENTARVDEKLAGWHALWLAWCFEHQGDLESASINYDRAKSRLGLAIPRYPFSRGEAGRIEETVPPFVRSLSALLDIQSSNSFEREWSRIVRSMMDLIGSPRQAEESVRALGELLGFEATRPDNDLGTGPDVMWCDNERRVYLGFELKTDKLSDSELFKKEVAQGHDHLQFMQEDRPGYECLGLVYVCDSSVVASQANPSADMYQTSVQKLVELKEEAVSVVQQIRQSLPIERRSKIVGYHQQGKFELAAIKERIASSLSKG